VKKGAKNGCKIKLTAAAKNGRGFGISFNEGERVVFRLYFDMAFKKLHLCRNDDRDVVDSLHCAYDFSQLFKMKVVLEPVLQVIFRRGFQQKLVLSSLKPSQQPKTSKCLDQNHTRPHILGGQRHQPPNKREPDLRPRKRRCDQGPLAEVHYLFRRGDCSTAFPSNRDYSSSPSGYSPFNHEWPSFPTADARFLPINCSTALCPRS
jgi:hypothetical protein